MKLRIKIALVIVIAAALAAVGASWKWNGPGKAGNANAPYKIAAGDVAPPGSSSGGEEIAGTDGWSWGDD
jgi:hypothetical protein